MLIKQWIGRFISNAKKGREGGGVETQRVINLLIRKITEDSSFLMNENS